MTKDNECIKEVVSSVGPTAPKDPVKKRSCLYVIMDTIIEASARQEGKPSQEFYMDNKRIIDKVKLVSGVTDENILNLLADCQGFLKLVHSVGVSVTSDTNSEGTVDFVFQNWGKVNIYQTGTRIDLKCPLDGTEVGFVVDEIKWSDLDDVIGKFGFEFDNVGDMATTTVKFYLRDGYEVPEITNEAPVDFESEEYRSMVAGSLVSSGNSYRLKAAIEKAKRGEDVTIAYIGGSITQGAGAKPINTGCYAYKSYIKFKEMFGKDGGDNIHFVKAGVGGTPSELGMLRYDRDILRNGTVEPDIVIIEFAVNDAGDETNGVCFESLCLKALKGPGSPAVILLFAVFLNDWNLQDRLAPIGEHYGLPMVSVKDAVVEQFKLTKEKGSIISKRQFFFDVYHPTNDGHTVMADCLRHIFEVTDLAITPKEDIDTEKSPLLGNQFQDVKLIDRLEMPEGIYIKEGGFSQTDKELQAVEMDEELIPTPEFPNNWMHTADSGNEPFILRLVSRSLVIIFKDSGNISFGKADVYVDGKLVKTLDPHVNNWTHCNPVIIYNEETSSEHEIRINMTAGDEDKCFTILGFGCV